jgi:hypothetical protein
MQPVKANQIVLYNLTYYSEQDDGSLSYPECSYLVPGDKKYICGNFEHRDIVKAWSVYRNLVFVHVDLKVFNLSLGKTLGAWL